MDQIYIGKTVYKVSDFISWQRTSRLELSPSFQRRPVWRPQQKSFLLDTVLRGLPTPVIYIRERTNLSGSPEDTREIVDGQQRLRTLFSYVDQTLLPDFNRATDTFSIAKKHDPSRAGATFAALDIDDQRKILNYEFSTHILPASTSDRDVLQIFARINSSGTSLNQQELRNAQFFGDFKVTMYDLARAQLQRWRDWTIFDEFQIARMEEVDLSNDLIMLMHYGIRGKNQSAITKFYKDREDDYPEAAVVAERFESVMDVIDRQLGILIPRTRLARQAMFYALFALYYDLQYGIGSRLQSRRPRRVPDYRTKIQQALVTLESNDLDEDLSKSLRGATTDAGTRSTRLKFLKEEIGVAS